MAYSITPILHHYKDKKRLQRVIIQVIYNRLKAYHPTDFRVSEDQFKDGLIVGHTHHQRMNAMVRKKMVEIEDNLISLIGQPTDLRTLQEAVLCKGKRVLFYQFISDFLAEKKHLFTKETQKAYGTVQRFIERDYPKAELGNLSTEWLSNVERDLFVAKLDQNTINKRMKMIVSFINSAEKKGLVSKAKYADYTPPKRLKKIPEYLTETEIETLYDVVMETKQSLSKIAGMYFLLSCYAGYRISDLKRFSATFIKDGKLVLRTQKNGQITAIPMHTRLRTIVEYCINHPITFSDKTFRQLAYSQIRIARIERDVTIHTARHSFAMMLMDRGFEIDEVAELLGNTRKAAEIYARISNKRLQRKILENFGD